LGKPSDALVRGFIDELLFGFFDRNGPLYHKRQVMSAINASLEMYRPLVEQRLSKQLGKVVREQPDQEFPFAAAFISLVASSWCFLDVPAREKVVEFIRHGKAAEVIRVLSVLHRMDSVRAEVETRVGGLSFEELAEAFGAYRLRNAGKNRAIQLLSEAHSWARVNEVIDKTILPLFDLLDRQDFEKIIRLPIETGADLIHAAGYGALIEKVRSAGVFNSDDLDTPLEENRASYLVNKGG
jgi:hypothetical protein